MLSGGEMNQKKHHMHLKLGTPLFCFELKNLSGWKVKYVFSYKTEAHLSSTFTKMR